MTGKPDEQPTGADRFRASGNDGSTASEFAGIGIQFVVSILAGMYGGQWLDRRFGRAPLFLIAGVFLGAVLSFYSMYRRLMAAQVRDDAARKARRESAP